MWFFWGTSKITFRPQNQTAWHGWIHSASLYSWSGCSYWHIHHLSLTCDATRNNLVTITIEPVDHLLSPYIFELFHAKPVTVLLFSFSLRNLPCYPAAFVLPNSSYLKKENWNMCSIVRSYLAPPEQQPNSLSISPQSHVYFYQANAY